jgi:hypothetical protein
LETDTVSFESVRSFKYLGSVVNQSNTIVNQSNAIVNQSNTIVNQINAIVNQSNTIVNQDNVIVNQSNTIVNQSNTIVNPSNTIVNQSNKIVNQSNTIEEEIEDRLLAGNKASSAKQKMPQSKLLSRKSKLKLYWTLIRPIVTYASENRFLKKIV